MIKKVNIENYERQTKDFLDYLKQEGIMSTQIIKTIKNSINDLDNLEYKFSGTEDYGKYSKIWKEFLEGISENRRFLGYFLDLQGSLRQYLSDIPAFVLALHIILASYNKDSSIIDERKISKLESGIIVSDEIKNNMQMILKITSEEIAA